MDSARWEGYRKGVLVVLSPAKKLAFQAVAAVELPTSVPLLHKETRTLMTTVRGLSSGELGKLMKLSPALSKLNYERFQQFDADAARPAGSRPAAFAFDGDTFVGLRAREMSKQELTFAQERVWILSGLYGVLRPLDAICPYRLEMGTRLGTERGRDLYSFWGDRIARVLHKQATKLQSQVLVNLASTEYFAVVSLPALGVPVVQPVFKEKRGGALKVLSFSAKRARGAMARYAVQNRLTHVDDLKSFAEDGYRFQSKGSTEREWLFVR